MHPDNTGVAPCPLCIEQDPDNIGWTILPANDPRSIIISSLSLSLCILGLVMRSLVSSTSCSHKTEQPPQRFQALVGMNEQFKNGLSRTWNKITLCSQTTHSAHRFFSKKGPEELSSPAQDLQASGRQR